MYQKIKDKIESLEVNAISDERKKLLLELTEFIRTKKSKNQDVLINFICTHNSRRSHLSQIWAMAMANYFGIENVHCYSGGTEATALFPMVATTLENSGFQVLKLSNNNNPIYAIKTGENQSPIIGFSKKYEDDFNPKSQFCAIMTCSSADGGCPFVVGCEKRIAITFEDPKAFDNTHQQAEKYEERSTQIATELKYVFSMVGIPPK